MSTRVVCPDCGDRLKLHKPAIDSTRVKCRNCGGKFYAGKAESWSDETEYAGGFHPVPGSAAVAVAAKPKVEISSAVETVPEVQPRRQRIRHEEPHKTPVWAMPVGIVAVLGIAVAGIFLGQTPDVPELNKSTETNAQPVKTAVARNDSDSLMTNGSTFRPEEIIGIWETSDVTGGRLDIASDGTILIRGAFLNQEILDLVSKWYTLRVNGNEFIIEVGPEPRLKSNHGMRLVKQADGSLVMTRYATAASLNVQERKFTKVK